MLRDILRFSVVLLAIAGMSYGIHFFTYTSLYPKRSLELLNFAYKFNVGITLLFTTTIFLVREKLKEQLGFIYLAGGFIKLAIFFYLIKTSGYEVNKYVFLHFFIPYVICVVVEIIYVVRILNRANFSKDK